MRQHIEHLRRKLCCAPRIIAVLLGAIGLSACLLSTISMHRVVTVTDEMGGSQVLLTSANHPEAIIYNAGMSAERHDQVLYTNLSASVANIVIRRAFTVTAEVDGITHTAELLDGTVADLLPRFDITLSGDDYVTPSLQTPLTSGLNMQVHRVTYAEETLRTEVSTELVDAYVQRIAEEATAASAALTRAETPDATPATVDFKPNKNNMYDATYRHTYINGELTNSEVVTLVPVITPRDAGSTEFIDGVPCSTIEGFEGISIGADGIPTTYSSKMGSAVSTAYSSSGGRGSSGLGLYCGTVAVNPNVIPYGTRMYITSPDNGFVYGFAIATDTGTALMDGRVDIDLYFATNAECNRFGKRALDVYILD